MAEKAGIEEVRERARDFTKALREAGADDVAARLDRHIKGFVEVTTVRRSVEAIRQQLRHFRAYPEELPEQPVVHIAANRLEDACKTLLRDGVIAPARMSLRAQSKRKLGLTVATLLIAALLFGVPLALAMSGVDFSDMPPQRVLPTVLLPKGAVKALRVNVLEESADPANTVALELYVAGRCPARLPDGMSCRDSGERAFGSNKLPAHEVMLPDEAYGIHIAFAEARLLGAVGTGTVLVTAVPETPEGLYVVPLAAAFVGYSPGHCNWLLQLLSRCEPKQLGPQALDSDRPVPSIRVRVTKEQVQPREDVLAQQRVAQQRALTARVQSLTAMLGAVRAALDDAEQQMRRKRFEPARRRLDDLARLFEPLDALVVDAADDVTVPDDVLHLRARFEKNTKREAAFEDKAFETVYSALSKSRGSAVSDDALFARVAKQLGVSVAFLERIYAEHADQIEQRMARAQDAEKLAEQLALDALTRRCGPLPKTSFREVQAYLTARARHSGARLAMRECMTPRLTPETCWSVVCEFEETRSVPDRVEDVVQRQRWSFELRYGRVVRHHEDAR